MESVRHKWHLLARHSCPRASIQSTSLAIQRRGMLLPLAAGLVWGRSANEITRLELAHPHPTLPPRLRGKGLVQRATTVIAVEKLVARRLSMCGSRQVLACEAADFVRNRLPRQSLEKSVGPRFDWRRPTRDIRAFHSIRQPSPTIVIDCCSNPQAYRALHSAIRPACVFVELFHSRNWQRALNQFLCVLRPRSPAREQAEIRYARD